jgi:hypothetical protein
LLTRSASLPHSHSLLKKKIETRLCGNEKSQTDVSLFVTVVKPLRVTTALNKNGLEIMNLGPVYVFISTRSQGKQTEVN